MASSAPSYQIILPDSRQIILVNARPGERVNEHLVFNPTPTQVTMIQCCDDILSVFDDVGPAYTTLLMKLNTNKGAVPTLTPLDGSPVLDHETCVKILGCISKSVRVNDFLDDKISDEHSVEIAGSHVEEKEEEVVCVICLEEIKKDEVFWLIECEHRYHEECIENWLKLKNVCPICRVEV